MQHHSPSSANDLLFHAIAMPNAQRTRATQTDTSHEEQKGFLLARHPQSVPAHMHYNILKLCQSAQKLMLMDRKNSNNNYWHECQV